jgi:hypothetical protein
LIIPKAKENGAQEKKGCQRELRVRSSLSPETPERNGKRKISLTRKKTLRKRVFHKNA